MLLLLATETVSCTKSDAPPGSPSSCVQSTSKKNACEVLPGEFPPPDCDRSAGKCPSGACKIDPMKCGSTSTCLPLANNAGKQVLGFRMRRLNFAAPDSLAAVDFQQRVVTKAIDLTSKECGEQGFGSWSWLLRIDKRNNTFTTGGAPPSADPFGVGFCFYDKTNQDFAIRPAQSLPMTLHGDSFSTTAAEKLYMPTFVNGDISNMIVIPMSNASFRQVTVSPDGNCIGALNTSALADDCSDDPAQCSKWKTAGAFAAHITLEEADTVNVPPYHQTLCALLTKTGNNDAGAGTPMLKCPRDAAGKIIPRGDYCSTTLKPCDCEDSFWVAATFAASAVTINDGSGVSQCGGVDRTDAGH
jgi:hypothetical protein